MNFHDSPLAGEFNTGFCQIKPSVKTKMSVTGRPAWEKRKKKRKKKRGGIASKSKLRESQFS